MNPNGRDAVAITEAVAAAAKAFPLDCRQEPSWSSCREHLATAVTAVGQAMDLSYSIASRSGNQAPSSEEMNTLETATSLANRIGVFFRTSRDDRAAMLTLNADSELFSRYPPWAATALIFYGHAEEITGVTGDLRRRSLSMQEQAVVFSATGEHKRALAADIVALHLALLAAGVTSEEFVALGRTLELLEKEMQPRTASPWLNLQSTAVKSWHAIAQGLVNTGADIRDLAATPEELEQALEMQSTGRVIYTALRLLAPSIDAGQDMAARVRWAEDHRTKTQDVLIALRKLPAPDVGESGPGPTVTM